jgi:predicted PurR-regulated permease PerM
MIKPPVPEKAGETAEAAHAHRNQLRILAAIFTLAGLWIARGFLLELAWAVTLAIALWPLYRRILPRGHKRPLILAPLAFTLATGLILIVPLAIVLAEAAHDSEGAIQWLGRAQKTGVPAPHWLGHLPLLGPRFTSWWQMHLGTPQGAAEMLGRIDAGAIASWVRTAAAEIVSRSFFFLVTLLAFFLILRDGERLSRNAVATARRFYGDFGERFLIRVAGAVRSAVNGNVLVALGEGTLIGLGYAATSVPRPVLFTVATIAFALLPFGAWAGFSVATAVLIVQGQVVAAIGLFLFGAAVMLIGDNLVEPALVGNAVRLPFLWTFVATFGGLEAFGLVGLFVGPAVMAALFLVWKEWLGLETAERPPRRLLRRRRPASG